MNTISKPEPSWLVLALQEISAVNKEDAALDNIEPYPSPEDTNIQVSQYSGPYQNRVVGFFAVVVELDVETETFSSGEVYTFPRRVRKYDLPYQFGNKEEILDDIFAGHNLAADHVEHCALQWKKLKYSKGYALGQPQNTQVGFLPAQIQTKQDQVVAHVKEEMDKLTLLEPVVQQGIALNAFQLEHAGVFLGEDRKETLEEIRREVITKQTSLEEV